MNGITFFNNSFYPQNLQIKSNPKAEISVYYKVLWATYNQIENARKKGDSKIALENLLDGMSINAIDCEFNESLLTLAIQKHDVGMVKFLIENGANPYYIRCLERAIGLVSYEPNIEIIKLLLGSGVSPSIQFKSGETPLTLACAHNDLELVSTLLLHKANPNTKDSFGYTPLYLACFNNNQQIAHLLVENGANLYKSDPLENEAIFARNVIEGNIVSSEELRMIYKKLESVSNSNKSEIQSLLSENNIHARDRFNDSLLTLAIQSGNVEMVKLLIEYGYRCKCDFDGTRNVKAALKLMDAEILKILLENGVDPNTRFEGGDTALGFACDFFNLEAVILLLLHKADSNIRDAAGHTPLHYVVTAPQCELTRKIEKLLKQNRAIVS